MSRFLVDAQLSRKLALRLAEHGHEASHVYDHLDPQADDQEIGRLANVMGASVISKDADFADLARRGLLEQTFVWPKLPNLSNQQLLEKLDLTLSKIVSAIEANDRIIEIR